MKYQYTWVVPCLLASVVPTLAAPSTNARRDNLVKQSDAPWGLQRISSGKKVDPSGGYVYQYDGGSDVGTGVDVYVLDTGVKEDGEFENGVTIVKNGLMDPGDYVGHGTLVAGVIGSTSYGVAKKVNILSVKIGDKNIDYTYVVEGVDGARKKHNSRKSEGNFVASVLNISLDFLNSSEMRGALRRAADAGMHIVVAAGNGGKDACESYPAAYVKDIPSIIVVGNLDMNDALHKTSNYGSCVDISAPGTDIESIGGAETGTSFSAPMVAGVIAGQAVKNSSLRSDPSGMKNHILSKAVGGISNLDEKAGTPDKILFMGN
ncbi:hypothetical protein H072_2141 [Dactylellina haptotyla CBS 200.50]|uniref:Peptidase S8/S53 domain-containing protein n=1 Tax=Dactylellina haptotyla (strain CBS 200.50) TaxID=1284197 RepID=S8C8C1_DACHA|nr:hypothetical protein H072_2141 [Dactylellina haptotyla CBS 200.50]